MSKCIYCGIPQKIHENGFIEFKVRTKGLINEVKNHLSYINIPIIEVDDLHVGTEYQNIDQVNHILTQVQSLTGTNSLQIDVSIQKKGDATLSREYHPIDYMIERISNNEVIDFITDGEIQSFLQPVVNLKNNDTIFGYENLLRSKSPNKGLNPGLLFEIARKTGLHSLLDKRARTEAIKTRAENNIPIGTKSFINFLPSTIYNPKFCLQHTFQVVDQYNINHEDLVFEVVETEKIDDVYQLKSIFTEYKASGMKVALDDVGTGYSSIDMLTKLQPDYVKVDRKFISFCDQSKEKQVFLNNVLTISKDLGIIVLGEGIERKEELEYCREIGMDLAQGYFIGKPAPAPYQFQ